MLGTYVGSLLAAGNGATQGAAFASFTTAASVLQPMQLVTLASNYLYAGKKLRITAHAAVGNVVTSQPTFTFQVMMGSIVVWSSGAITCTTTVAAALPSALEILLKVVTVGKTTAATFWGIGKLTGIMFGVGAVAQGTYGTCIMVPVGTPAAGTGFDSTIANILDFWVGCSASSASNTYQLLNYDVEDLN